MYYPLRIFTKENLILFRKDGLGLYGKSIHLWQRNENYYLTPIVLLASLLTKVKLLIVESVQVFNSLQ